MFCACYPNQNDPLAHFEVLAFSYPDPRVAATWGGLGQDTMQNSSYVWSLNWKPFHSSEWQKHKMELLEAWLGVHDADSEDFRKFAERIAIGFHIFDYDDSDPGHRQRLFDMLYDMVSFRQQG